MNTKKDAPTSAATLAEAGAEIAACGRAAISYNNFTTAAAGRQIKIADYLSHGQENAIPRRELERTNQHGRADCPPDDRAGAAGRDADLRRQPERLLPPGHRGRAGRLRPLMRHRAGEIMRTARAIEQAEG